MSANMEEIVQYIQIMTKRNNLDNIARTKAYLSYYMAHPEIKWAFLASMVSRNAGWNMTDLYTPVFKGLLSGTVRKQLFSTYERANWLIFSDAYPQLLIYQFSKQLNQPLFELLPRFHVTRYMEEEWRYYWQYQNRNRLMRSLIINEQNVIEQPVIKNPYYRKHVFLRIPYLAQDFFLVNAVLFPDLRGQVIGSYVHDFSNLNKRIVLGKKLAAKLFSPHNYHGVLDFALHIEPTGSRDEYEQFFSDKQASFSSPELREVYSVINHQDRVREDWSVKGGINKKWLKAVKETDDLQTAENFYKKRKLLERIWLIKQIWK
ncbi:DUF2515 family protein [Sediminibacillus albus]|uniref:DUF2515 domain-containing protein n=1 Tax=Sediminibacillus albus TaxID=407036 RepID=A0A1G8VQ87_9BACI|nr:DUF2515 family protein [Sediminibacillus albus]SDJ68037.1 Protein of unknown function [Sediminibacillus albus]